MIATWLTDRFDLTVPLVSAPMAGVCDGRFAAAVSAAGALGMVAFGAATAEDVEREAHAAARPGRPFGIGFIAWTLERQPDVIDAAIAGGPALISLSFGEYASHVDRIKSAGIAVATQAGTVEDARAAVEAGVDIVVARGGEAGGHGRDQVATLPLLQAVVAEVDGPVLAAGGIASAPGMAAVLAAGAAGAWVGTAFLACDEVSSDARAREAVLAAGLTDTVYTTVLDVGRGMPWPPEFGGRAVRNAFADRWHGRESELAAAGERTDEPAVWAGQAVGLVRATRPVADVVAELATAEELLLAAARRCR